MSMFPFDKAGAAKGPARVLYAPVTEAVPADLSDIVALVNTAGDYAPQGGWLDFGLAAEAPSYARSIETEGLEYEQPTSVLFEQITEVNRQLTVNVAQLTPEALQIIENAPSIEAVAAVANEKGAQSKIPYGLFDQAEQYRFALVTQRPRGAQDVTEPDGTVRGGLLANVILRAGLAAEDSEFEPEKGSAASIPVTFAASSEDGQPSGEEFGFWIAEDGGTIPSV